MVPSSSWLVLSTLLGFLFKFLWNNKEKNKTASAWFLLIFGLDPSSWYRAAKSLGISWMMGASFVLMRWLLVGSCMGAGHQKDQAMIRSLQLSGPLPPFSRKGREADWAKNPSCPHDEASIKIPEIWVSESSWVLTTWRRWEGGDSEVLCPFLHTLLYASLPSGCSWVAVFLST